MSGIIKAPRGMFDILPEDMPLWSRLESASREAFRRYGYGEMRTPLIEETRLYVRGIGDTTDIVEKEMYTFPGKGPEESQSLRPEATAGIVRAYIEHNYHKIAPFQKFCYTGPMFRYERPQAGRQRQFYQVGVEVLGTSSPTADVETMALALDILRGAGLSGMRLKVNTVGCRACRDKYREAVRRYLAGHLENLCADCRRRFERNILRVLDCKVESCRRLIEGVPAIEEYLCGECTDHFAETQALLDVAGVEYVKDKFLVRGLDYYTRTVYEIAHSALGARDAVGGGGRYDNLVEELGGPPTPAVGFSLGVEATLLALKNSGAADGMDDMPFEVSLVLADAAVSAEAFKLLTKLRAAGVQAEMPFDFKSMKAQMRGVNRRQSRLAVILGPDELARGTATVKNMAAGEQSDISLEAIIDTIKEILATEAG